MKKRTLALAALTAAMTLGMSLTSFAAEEPNWIIPKATSERELNQKYGTTQWWAAEALEQARAWAEANKGDIVGIQDQKAQYEAIVKKVCDFLTYDINYTGPHIAYTIKDGKGVCADYVALTAALCEKVGISYQIVEGSLYGTGHELLIVTVDGQSYYSDPTGYDSGATGILSSTPTAGFTEASTFSGLKHAVGYTGMETDSNGSGIQTIEAAKSGMVPVTNVHGTYYITKEDNDLCAALMESGDYAGMFKVLDKYSIPHN